MAEERKKKYLRMFADEVSDHIEVIVESLSTYENSGDPSILEEILRRMHTIKGSAYMVGLEEAGKVAHLLEDSLKEVRGKEKAACDLLLPDIYKVVDGFSNYLESGLRGSEMERLEADIAMLKLIEEMEPQPEINSRVNNSRSSASQTLAQSEIDSMFEVTESLGPANESSKSLEAAAIRTASASEPGEAGSQVASETVRVDILKLDRMLELASELVTFQSRLAARAMNDAALAEEMTELGYLVEDIHCQAMEVRMLPVSTVLKDFYRNIRSLSRELGKEATLSVSGMNVEVDKRILELVKPVIIHTLRNAVDHGLETPEERKKKGKPSIGTVQLLVQSDGNFITFTIRDDGQGINTDKIAEKAIESGLLSPSDIPSMSEGQIVELIFESGLSTAESLTAISGRGVGMDVVKRSIEEMKGTLTVDTSSKTGTTIEFSVPTSLSVINALMVKAGGHTYALPLSGVVETVRFTSQQIIRIGKSNGLNLRGEAIVLSYLPTLLGFSDSSLPAGSKMSAVVIRQRSDVLALVVDEILGDEEVVVKSLGSHIRSVNYVSGATFLPSGKPALILRIPELITRPAEFGHVSFSSSDSQNRQGKVLIVDDSITTQMMESSILQVAGYEPYTVSSAEEAIKCIEDGNRFDIFVVDIEMPGMNGVELIEWMDQKEALFKIPKILLSSADSEDLWERGRKLSVSSFIRKQEFNQNVFLKTIKDLLKG